MTEFKVVASCYFVPGILCHDQVADPDADQLSSSYVCRKIDLKDVCFL